MKRTFEWRNDIRVETTPDTKGDIWMRRITIWLWVAALVAVVVEQMWK